MKLDSQLFWKGWGQARLPASMTHQGHMPLDCLNQAGCFETVRVSQGRPVGLEAHMRRLKESAKTLGLPILWTDNALEVWLKDVFMTLSRQEVMARLTLIQGNAKSLLMCLIVKPFLGYPKAYYSKGVHIQTATSLAGSARAIMSQAKSNQYLNGVMAKAESRPETFETIFLNSEGFVTEGTVSNLFLIKDGQAWTPPKSCGILLGVTRSAMIQIMARLGIKCHETLFSRHALYGADEVFLTNTSAEAMPVSHCDGRLIGQDSGFVWTKKIHKEYIRGMYAKNKN